MINVQQTLVNIENDHRDSRTNLSLNYGNLSGIENSPTATWSGTVVGLSDEGFIPTFWDVTFTRLDDRNITPICELGFDYIPLDEYGKYYDEIYWHTFLLETGNNYVKFRICLVGLNLDERVSLSVVAQAISPVNGSLSIARV